VRLPSQESVLKIISGMNNDTNPLNFRGKYERDRVTPDVYYRVAPNWSTLSGGSHPTVNVAPDVVADYLVRAGDMVPFIRSTPLYVIRASNNLKEKVSLEDLKAMKIAVQPVPNLHVKPQQREGQEVPQRQVDAESKAAIAMLREEIALLKDYIARMSAPPSEASSSASHAASPSRTPAAEANKPAGKKRARREK